jgi:hypothetical protein
LSLGVTTVLASCMPARGPHDTAARYVATQANITSLSGVSASITEYDPYYSGSNATGTNASFLLLGGTGQWAQLGWAKSKITGSLSRQSYLEFFRSPTDNNFQWFGARAIGHNTAYRINYTPPDTYDFLIDGMWVSQWHGQFSPGTYQMFGETHDFVDQMPGGVNTHEVFSSSKYYTGSGHTSHTQTAGITNNDLPLQWGGTHPSSGRYEIWDKPCTN